MKLLKRTDLMSKLIANKHAIFSMIYKKASGETRHATCRLHVSNPQHTLVPGTGKFKGQTAETAYEKHFNIKYFDCGVDGNPRVGQTFGKGDFRTAKIQNIEQITIAGEIYQLID